MTLFLMHVQVIWGDLELFFNTYRCRYTTSMQFFCCCLQKVIKEDGASWPIYLWKLLHIYFVKDLPKYDELSNWAHFCFLCCPTVTQCVAGSEGRRQGRSQELRIFTQATRLHGKISKTANFWGQFLFVGKIKTCLLSLINISPNHQPWHFFDMFHWISYELHYYLRLLVWILEIGRLSFSFSWFYSSKWPIVLCIGRIRWNIRHALSHIKVILLATGFSPLRWVLLMYTAYIRI